MASNQGREPRAENKVIQLARVYPLTATQHEAFDRDGHILLRNVATADQIARFRRAIQQACLSHNTESREISERDTYGKAFLQVTNLWTRDDTVKEFVFNGGFARIAASLLGVERVRLYHDQALFKEPGGGKTPWHQDQYYWPLDTDRTITMWMPLIDIDDGMGLMKFASGSHKGGPIGSIEISDESESAYKTYIAERGFPVAYGESMSAGDATFHRGWTIHGAGANTSSKMRSVMTVIYFADGARVTRPDSLYQQADCNAWLDGKLPGEIASGPLNPILN